MRLGLVLAAFLTIAIFFTIVSGQAEVAVFNPPYLLLTLGFIFWIGTTVAISYVSAKSYIKEGTPAVLLLASAVLIFGLSNIVASAVQQISGNYSVAIGNSCILISSILQVVAGVAVSTNFLEGKLVFNRKAQVALTYVGSTLFVLAFSGLVFANLLPPFFTASGPTMLRQVVLGTVVLLLAVAFLIFAKQYLKSKSPGLFWYSLAVGLMSVGLFSAFETKQLGDVVTWLARATLYSASFFLLAAILERGFEGEAPDAELAVRWAAAFRSDRRQIASFFSKISEGFAYCKIIADKAGKSIDFVYLDVNDAFEKMMGKTKANIVGKRNSEIYPDMDNDSEAQNVLRIYAKVAETGESTRLERYSKYFDKWLSISVYSPKKEYFTVLAEDITERKKAEKEIASLAKFPLENPAVVLRVDQKGVILFANPVANDFLKKWQTKVGETVPENIRQKVVDTLASGTKFEFEENLGEEIFSFLVTPIIPEGYANLYGRGITKRKKAELKLEEYAKNLELLIAERTKKLETNALYARSLIEASLDPLVTISVEGKITDVNKATELATGYSREELIGSDFSNYFTEPEKAAAGYKQVFTEGFVMDYPLAIRHKSGKVTEVLYNASVYRNVEGQVQGVFAAARDITERKNLENQLQEKERLAAIGSTAGMVGHDIRNPLQAIIGDVYLLKSELSSMPEGEAKQNMKESLEGIDKNVQYVDKIVQDLQDYTRPLKPVTKEVNLRNLCEDVLSKSGLPKNIKGSCRVDEAAKLIVTDSDLMRRVLTNLVANAIQAMPKGGKLSIRGYRREGEVAIEVRDTGVGIPDNLKPKLFTPLFTTKSKGQGFGLAAAKRVIESMNGTITFESEEGKGTTFVVHFS